jgi:hypothetical protein
MIRKIALAGAGAALALAGVAALAAPASAGKPVITSVTAANIQCNLLPTKANVVPSLKNNWVAANHNGINDVGPAAAGADPVRQETGVGANYNDTETNAHVKALPNTKYSTDGNNTVSSKSKTASCTGSVTGAAGTFAVTSLKIELGNFTNGTDNNPQNTDNTCQGLLAGTPAGDVAATYKATIAPKLNGANLSPKEFVTNGLSLVAGGGGAVGFQISGGTAGAPFTGANSKTTAYVSGDVLAAVGAGPATSAAPTPTKAGAQCEASLKIKDDKPGKPGSATLKGPKGFKKIQVGNNVLPPNQASNICIRIGSTCP